MSYEKFRSFLDGLFQVGRCITVPNPTKGIMKCRVQIGEDGGAVLISLPPGGEFQFTIGTASLSVHIEGIETPQRLDLAGEPPAETNRP